MASSARADEIEVWTIEGPPLSNSDLEELRQCLARNPQSLVLSNQVKVSHVRLPRPKVIRLLDDRPPGSKPQLP